MHGLRKGHHYSKGECDEKLRVDDVGAAASGRGGTTSHRRASLSRYYLELMASFTAMTVLDRVREKVVGGGTEVGHDCEHTMHPNAVS